MSRKRSHKMAARAYRQAVPDAHARVMAGQRVATLDEALIMAQRMGSAVELITQGRAEPADWGTVVDVLNLVEALVTLDVLAGQAEVMRLMGVMTVVLERRAGQGTQALYASELADLRGLSAVWAEAVQAVPLDALRRAEQMVVARQQRILATLKRRRVAGLSSGSVVHI